MNSNKKAARIAGMWYLFMALFYTFSMIYVDSSFYVPGDVVSTVNNILASEWIFRLGFISCLIGHICFLFLANALYKLFKPVDSNLARQMVILIIVGVSVAFLNRLNQLASVLLLNGAGYLSSFKTSQLHALAMVFLDLHKHGGMITMIFWGLWLLPLGLLIFKSDIIPKVLGILLISACFCYLIDFFVFFFFPGYIEATDTVFSVVEAVAEVSFILWLLIRGVKGKKSDACGVT
ncbi:MAG: DUF4386 domain-containing protein [Clostridia bacterium]|nr:DUF4386 domain-containing protein [Clostridia bacterium]